MKAFPNQDILVWAREDAGYSIDEAAKKIRVSGDRLMSWELGNDQPTIKQLRKTGKVYKRPLAIFYLPKPPKKFQALRDYRRLPRSIPHTESPALRFEIRQAHYRRDVALSLYEELGEKVPALNFKIGISDDPEKAAQVFKKHLGIVTKEQLKWRDKYKALNNWRQALENAGVMVFQITGVELEEVRGFSVFNEKLPIIAVNIKDSPRGRVFSMLHEFAHIITRSTGICNLENWSNDAEVFCNHVAGAMLIPKQNLLQERIVKEKTGHIWKNSELESLARKYSVSEEVVLRRLLIVDKTTHAFYREKHEEFNRKYHKARKRAKKKGYSPPHQMAVSKAGHLFSGLVLEGFYRESLTTSDLSNYFGVKIKHLPKIEESVVGFSSNMGGAYAV